MLSLLLALGLGCILATSAHWIGSWIKQSSGHAKFRRRAPYYVAIVLALSVIVPLFYVLALVREQFIQFMEQTAVSLGEILQQEGFTQTAETLLETDLTSAGWTLLLSNVAIIGLGIGCSFLRHDAHPDYESLTREAEKAKRRYNKIREKYESKINSIAKDRDEKMARLEKQHERIASDLAEIEKARGAIRECEGQNIKKMAIYAKRRIQTYEAANREARRDSAIPAAFNNLEEVDLKHEIDPEYVDVSGRSASADGFAH